MVQSVFENLPFKPFAIALFYILRINGFPKNMPDGYIHNIRFATPEDINRLNQCMNKEAKFRARFKQGDRCILALVEDRVAGFLWFCVNEYHIEEPYGYKLCIPENAVYVYDGFISPEYRRKKIFKQLWLPLTDWMKSDEKNIILVIVEYGNNISLNIHHQMGFLPVTRKLFLRFLRFRCFVNFPIKKNETCSLF
jgi:hypothetical protein